MNVNTVIDGMTTMNVVYVMNMVDDVVLLLGVLDVVFLLIGVDVFSIGITG